MSSLPGVAECSSSSVSLAGFSELPRYAVECIGSLVTGPYLSGQWLNFCSLAIRLLSSLSNVSHFISISCTCLFKNSISNFCNSAHSLTACSSSTTFFMIIFFQTCIFPLAAWNSWKAIYLKMASAVLLVLVIICASRFVTFLLVGLKTPILIRSLLSASSSSSM